MSKIYEALQRAEQERAAASAAPAQSLAPSPTEAAGQNAGQFPSQNGGQGQAARLPAASGRAFPAAAESFAQGRQSPGSSAGAGVLEPEQRLEGPAATSALEAVCLTQWNPVLDKLQALQERGRPVEQFRSLRSRLFEFRDLNTLKSIVVSSGLPQEGKSFVAANLAISFARHKSSRVLLIDGDMRRGSLHHLLGTRHNPGLTDYLSGKATLEEIVQRAQPAQGEVVHAGLASLSFIACGDQGDQAADLSGNPRFDKLIQTLSPHFDWIVVDSSPVNLVTDAVNLARACDGVLLIARGGVTKIETVQQAMAEFKSSRMLGVVLNAVEKPPTIGSYYGYDSYDSVKE